MDSPKAIIIYASLTGCNEELAKETYLRLKTKNVEVSLIDANNADAKDYLESDICIAVSYSYESYDEILPDEMIEIYEGLEKLDLSGKIYGVLGTGQDIYDDYCGAVDKLDQQFAKTGALKGSESIKIEFELSEKEDEARLDEFIDELLEKHRQNQIQFQK